MGTFFLAFLPEEGEGIAEWGKAEVGGAPVGPPGVRRFA